MTPVWQTLDLALQHFRRGEWQHAEQLYLQVLAEDPGQVDALHILAMIAGQTGRADRAIEYLRAVLRARPGWAGAHNTLGMVFITQNRLPEAAASFQEAARLEPEFAVAHSNLGNALRALGRPADAVASLQRALRLAPGSAEAYYNLGLAWQALNNPVEAHANFQHAVSLKPGYAEAQFQLGITFGQFHEAETSLEETIRLDPGCAQAHHNLGMMLQEERRFEAAIASYETALRLEPVRAETYRRIANVRTAQGRLDDAIDAYRAALRLKSDDEHIHSALIFTLNYHPGHDARMLREEYARWSQQHAEPLRALIRPHTNRPDPARRLRIGYVSPDFRDHADSFFTIPLLSNHDHRECEIFCYSGVARPDALTDRLRGYADVWRSTVGLTDQQLADLVRRDEIDILVDLKMQTANNRLLVFARKPAPVQVAWLAYPGTTGLSTMDYRLTDPYLDPPGLFDAFYSEESFRLPETFWCYDPLSDEPSVNAPPARAGVITFGSLNNFHKVNEECLRLWSRVLKAVPESRLLLLAPRDPARERVLAILEEQGIGASHVEFAADRLSRLEYLSLYHRIDVALDPLPYNGHTTSLDAFWMGVPTLTTIGKTVVGRAGWSQLCNLGLQDLAAETPDEFVELAVRLTGDRRRLEELRSTLRLRMQASPLMDGRRFARHVEEAYRQMWCRWCERARHESKGAAVSPVPPSEGQGAEVAESPTRQSLVAASQHFRQGRWQEAEQLCRRVLEVDQEEVDALHLLAVITGQTGREDEAAGYLRTVVRLRPASPDAHNNLGNVLMLGNAQKEQAKLDEAIANYRQAVRLRPDFSEAFNNLGNALLVQEQLADAEACLRQALLLKPTYADAHYNLGIVLSKLHRLDEAVACHQQALRLNPGSAEAHVSLGNVYSDLGRLDDAIDAWRAALALKPEHAGAHHNLGRALEELGRHEEAIVSLQAALQIKPDYADALLNLGSAYDNLGRYDEAAASYRRALDHEPEMAGAHNNLGTVLYAQGNFEAADACFRRAIDLEPDYAHAHWNQALSLLLQGEFERGWAEYEWRWKLKNFEARQCPQPAWDGSPLEGKTILLAAEQGLGDTIQFIRFAPLVRQRGGRVLVEVQPPLRQLLSTAPGIDQLLVQGEATPPFDTHVPLLSLPRWLLAAQLETVPADVPYLAAAPALVDRWRDEVRSLPGFKIGIAWHGSPHNHSDRGRSFPLDLFETFARLPDVTLVSLQKGQGSEQIAELAGRFRVIDFGDRLDTDAGPFMDTAAIVQHLDLVVTCDSALAHLAGALCVPVWIALMLTPDWRWQRGRDDSPWYPTARLFRQTRVGEWRDVFDRMAAELRVRRVSDEPMDLKDNTRR
jgi:protein O-GlcNAc transferase